MTKVPNSATNLGKASCERLFTYRREQAWPPKLVKGPNWSAVYKDARETLRDNSSIFKTVDEAIRWTNDLIKEIEAAESKLAPNEK